MRYLITGGTGFIGTAYTAHLLSLGHEVVIVSRGSKKSDRQGLSYTQWDGKTIDPNLAPVDVVLNLAGSNVGEGRWTPAHKESVIRSRIDSTTACVNWIKAQAQKPKVFLSASGINYYGGGWSGPADETREAGSDFMAEVCIAWEKASRDAGIRTVQLRTGIVFGLEAGPLPAMAKPFKLFVGGRLGNGRQHMPWLHLKDWMGIADFCVEREDMNGPLNLCVPKPLQQKQLAKLLGRVLKRPSFWVVPAFVLKMLLGEMATIVMGDMEAYPKKLEKAGYRYLFTDPEKALRDIFGK
jgi:uncharacterized protein (TIGR01777 family)